MGELTISTVANAQAPRDLVLVNGHVYTANDRQPTATAVSILDGRIAEVGRDEDVLAATKAGTPVIDLNGKTVVPGFIDAHLHLTALGFSLLELNVTGTPTYQAVVLAVAERVKTTPAGAWIVGRGWDQNDWPGKAFPTHAALSVVSPNNPVALTRIDGHAMLVNAAAMKLAGITAETPDPPGGKIYKDSQGNPTGVLVDRAMDLMQAHIPPPTEEQRKEAVQEAIRHCLMFGLTSVQDAGVDGGTIGLYKQMIDAGEFNLRVYAMIRATDQPTLERYFKTGPLIDYGDGRLTVRCVKVIADGALGSRGAALLAGYSDDPDNTGLLMITQDYLEKLTESALRAGFQVATHAIGDRANHLVLDAYEKALAAAGLNPEDNDARLRIEHAQVVTLDDIPRFAKLHIIPSMQATHATSDMYWAQDRLGPDRIEGAYAWQRFIKSGSRIADGSDAPVESANPLLGFYAAITRQDANGWPEGGWHADQRMTREQALRSFTINAAYAAFEEKEKGSIEPGKRADLAVLSQDIMKIPPEEILKTETVMTLFDGAIVFRRPGV